MVQSYAYKPPLVVVRLLVQEISKSSQEINNFAHQSMIQQNSQMMNSMMMH
jgi:hypothetical protein